MRLNLTAKDVIDAAKSLCNAYVFSFVLLVGLPASASSQTTADGTTPRGIAPGAPAGSYPLSGFEQVDLYSGRVNFSLPVVAMLGRGGAGIPINVRTVRTSSGKWSTILW